MVGAPDTILETVEVTRRFPPRGGALLPGGAGVVAVDRVSLKLEAGEAVGLLGRSGSGKSTLARLLVGLERPDAGEVRICGQTLQGLAARRLAALRRQVPLVFQDPLGALDPLQDVGAALEEPLVAHRLVPPAGRSAAVREMLASVGLSATGELLARRPNQLSGGERQRVALARSLACAPRALILDEPVSALDLAVQGRILNLLVDVRARLGLAILLVSHDVSVLARLCERVVVLERGKVVEEGPIAQVLREPSHPATRALLAVSTGVGARLVAAR